MKAEKKTGRKISIKWSIFGYLLIFIFILLAILWVMQTVYLESFYKNIKERELKSAVSKVVEVMNGSQYKDEIEVLAKKNDIRVILGNSDGDRVYSTGSAATENISRMDSEQIKKLYKMAQDNGGEVHISSKKGLMDLSPGFDRPERRETAQEEDSGQSESRMMESMQPETDKNGEMQGSKEDLRKMFDIPENSGMETMIVAKIMTNAENEEILIIADSVITPVTATVHAIRIQLLYISVIMIVLSLIMAILISFHISKPIIHINNTAKKISDGDLNIEFAEKGYREIAEMSATLNYTVNELTKSERLQRELIANVSHDLRTPLTMITAYAEVMRDLPGENTPENVQVIIDEAKRLTGLVNDLLDISKLQAGVSEIKMAEYNLTNGVKAVMDRYAKLVEQQGYKIIFCYDQEVWVEADEFKIYQVLYNLVNNAVNYTGEDKTVTVSQVVNGGIVRIEVRDTGEGIAQDQLENVWDRYYKIDKNHKRAVMGTGLGLSIVKNILKQHDARYGVKSKPGQGSTFWFELKTIHHNEENR